MNDRYQPLTLGGNTRFRATTEAQAVASKCTDCGCLVLDQEQHDRWHRARGGDVVVNIEPRRPEVSRVFRHQTDPR
jgi:hypothetical protein